MAAGSKWHHVSVGDIIALGLFQAGPWAPMMNLHAVMALMLFCHAANGLEDPERILQQAIVLHQAGQLEPAISQYRAYLKLRPDAVDARSNLGVALASTGHYREAIAEYREALKRRPQDSHIRLNVALAQYKLGQISDAAASLSALHRQQPADRQIMLLLADCWLRQGEDRKVIDLVTPVAEQNRHDLAIAYLLGTALLRDKQIDRGQQMIDRILRNGDSAEAHLLLGTARLNAREYEAAIADFEKAAQLNPHLPDVYSYLGRAHIQTGDTAAARLGFQKELAQNPNDFESNLNLAALLKQDQDYDGAFQLLDRALRVRPGELRAVSARCRQPRRGPAQRSSGRAGGDCKAGSAVRGGAHLPGCRLLQIGRASCRERV